MFNLYSQLIPQKLLTAGSLSFLFSLVVLVLIHKSSNRFLSFLYVDSPKSPTGARLLGGFALSIGIISSLFFLYFAHSSFTSPKEGTFILSFIASALVVTIGGYIDDRFEIRARYKLLFQFIAVSFLTFQSVKFLGNNNQLTAYMIVTLVGFLLVNGNNLLDGLDTLAIKLSGVTASAFIFLGVYSGSILTVAFSVLTIAALGAFYIYNRAPAQIYLGEIGGSLLGLIFTAQTILCYQNLREHQYAFSAMSFVLVAISLPICELGISFLRRVYFNKSPFRGDKLHLHYILKTKANLSAGAATNIMALAHLSIVLLGFTAALLYSSVFAMLLVNTIYSAIYVSYCKSEWIKGQGQNPLSTTFGNLENKTVYLINSSDLDRISYKLLTEEFERESKAASKRTA